VVKVLVRTFNLSLLAVDKPLDSVDKRWIEDLPSLKKAKKVRILAKTNATHPQKARFIHSYPHLFHIWG
jgi:hypothetical protein